MGKVNKKVRLEKLDPTGVVCETYSFDYECEDDDSMLDYMYILSFGDYVHVFTKDGKYIRKIGE